MKFLHPSSFDSQMTTLVSLKNHPALGASLQHLVVPSGEEISWNNVGEEQVIVLYCGSALITAANGSWNAIRRDPFVENPWVLQTCRGTDVRVIAKDKCEFLIASAPNDKLFEPYASQPQQEVVDEHFLEGRAMRIKRPFFMRGERPQTNLFCGELVVHQGSWACYPPHQHVEPEIYYYRFSPAGGYAFVEDGSVVHRIEDHDIVGVVGGDNHSQAVAPGYQAYVLWIQRLQDNGRDIDYSLDPRYAWLRSERYGEV